MFIKWQDLEGCCQASQLFQTHLNQVLYWGRWPRTWHRKQVCNWVQWPSPTRNNLKTRYVSVVSWGAPHTLVDRDRAGEWPIHVCLCLWGGNLQLPTVDVERQHLLKSNLSSIPFNLSWLHALYSSPFSFWHYKEQGEQARDPALACLLGTCTAKVSKYIYIYIYTVMSSLKDQLTGLCGKLLFSDWCHPVSWANWHWWPMLPMVCCVSQVP